MDIYSKMVWICPECLNKNTVEIANTFDDCQLCENCGIQYEVIVDLSIANIKIERVEVFE